jgi:CBS domain-containing protein
MTKSVVSVYPEEKLMKAHERMFRHGFNALPVVDKDNHLVGILADYDLVMAGSSLHLPTFQSRKTKRRKHKFNL